MSALFGFSRIVTNLLTDECPKVVAAVFDSRGKTFRHHEYPEYKATRQKAPDDLHAQVPLVETFLDRLGIPVLRVEGFEADDVIATLIEQHRDSGRNCYIVSGDKDLLQLVGGNVYELRPIKRSSAGGASFISNTNELKMAEEGGGKSPLAGFEIIDAPAVLSEWGVPPESILDYLALTGDSSDNVPGVRGIGEKTAQKLLLRFGSLDAVYDNIAGIDQVTSKKLNAGRESAYLSKKLITLRTDVPLPPPPLAELDFHSLRPAEAAAYLHEQEIRIIAGELGRLAGKQPLSGAGKQAASGGGRQAAAGPATAGQTTGADASPAATPPLPPQPRPNETALPAQNTAGGEIGALPSESGALLSESGAQTAAPAALKTRTTRRPLASKDIFYHSVAELPDTDAVYRTIIAIDEIDALFTQAAAQGFLAFDFETDSLETATANIVGFSFALKPKEAYYTPVLPHGVTREMKEQGRTPDTPFIPGEQIKPLLAKIFANPALTIVVHNAKFDYKISRAWGLPRWKARIFDTMVAAWVADPDFTSYSLERLAFHYLRYESSIAYSSIVPKDETFQAVPLDLACRYSAEDADICLRLKELLEGDDFLAKFGGDLFYTKEMPLLPILAEMEIEGIRIDTAELEKYGRELGHELSAIQYDTWQLVGHEFNLSSPLQLQHILFTERGLRPIKKTSTGWSTDMSVLEALAGEDEVCRKILRHRTLSKLKSTYVDALCALAGTIPAGTLARADYGRIHTTFFQTGTATGRLSSRDPNLQNIPVREEEGRRIREAFTAGYGHVLISADYNQIELVVLAHLSGDTELCASFIAGEDVHARTAALIFGIPPETVSAAQRRIAKTINFGVMYGMSAFRLASSLGISRSEAQRFIAAYFKTYAGVHAFIDELIAGAEKNGYVSTMFGRRRLIRQINSANKVEKAAAERIAVNTPIQGSAADIVKIAMIKLDSALSLQDCATKILLQVHDELILECPEAGAANTAALVQRVMEDAVPLNIPLRVTVETGKRWGEFH